VLEFARWKYILVSVVLLVALLFALPNVFGDDTALQIARKDRAVPAASELEQVEQVLKAHGVTYKRAYLDGANMMIRFADDAEQRKARDVVRDEKNGLTQQYVNAMMYASRAPSFLQALHLRAMPLGLDLRGGLYLLYQVDVDGAVDKLLQSYDQDIRRGLRADNITFNDISSLTVESNIPNGLRVQLPAGADTGAVRATLRRVIPDIACRDANVSGGAAVDCVLTPTQVTERRNFAITQNITTLRNRVNELGVSEPIVQRQGLDRIAVQLPGVQNSAEVKDKLGKVATLEFRLVDPRPIPASGRAPVGAKIYKRRLTGEPVMLKREVIATGDQLINATSSVGQQGPEVQITLNSAAGDEMLRTTRANVGKPMGTVFIEQRTEIVEINGEKTTRTIKDEQVINTATIQGVFGSRFQTTGLSSVEAQELAQLLRGGALSAPISIANEYVIGPTLGKENIRMGVTALVVGMIALFIFMIIYYQVFGIVADLVLLANVVLLTALLSMIGTALSLPGIAGIILTVGMAVDANVLIYERIREELRNGVSPQAAIRAGFDKAFSAILDSNITTLIAGVVLWVFGTGAIRGFAVVLSLGILTSMFTALLGSRALLTLMYGGKRKPTRLAIG